MGFQVGDTIFSRAGKPTVLTGRNEGNGELQVQAEGEKIAETKKRGYINGLNPEERVQFNEIIDKMRTIPEPEKRLEELQTKIDEIKADPRQRILTRYLSSEMAHLMNTHRIAPKEYKVPEWEVEK